MIPKPNGGGERALGIPTIRDRVVQTAAKLVLERIFEADFEDNAYGVARGGAVDAVKEVHRLICRGYTDVVDADLSKDFDFIPHGDLLKSVARRVADGAVLRLIKLWLKAPIEERGGAAPSYRAHPRLYRTEPPAVSALSSFLGEERESDFEHLRTALGPGADIPDQGKVFCPRDRPRPCRSSWRAVF